ncbi:MAG TPA: hypothetical protein VFD92_04595 [Candidatus Binatia bacterium]|nr:hypothetical protein [Candidatus Binatia bacterium]
MRFAAIITALALGLCSAPALALEDSVYVKTIAKGLQVTGLDDTRTDSSVASQLTGGVDETIDNTYEAFRFATGTSGTAGSKYNGVRIWVKKTGSPAATDYIELRVYTNSGSSKPNTEVTANFAVARPRLSMANVSTSLASFDFGLPYALSDSTTYWVVIKKSLTAGTVVIDRRSSGTGLYAFSSDASTWTLENSKEPAYAFLTAPSTIVKPTTDIGYAIDAAGAGLTVRATGTRLPAVAGIGTDSYGLFAQSTNGSPLAAVTAAGAGVEVDATGLLQSIGGGGILATKMNGTAVDDDRYYQWDCNTNGPGTPGADKMSGYCVVGSPDRWYVKNDAGTLFAPPPACSTVTQGSGETCLTTKGQFATGRGSTTAAGTTSPGADGTYKQADSSAGDGWADKLPYILDTVKQRTVATNRGGTSTASDDDDGGAGPDLTFSAAANTTYIVELDALYTAAGTTTDLKLGWNIPASATVEGVAFGTTGTANDGGRTNSDSGTVVIQLLNGTNGVRAKAKIVIAGTSGTVALFWSGNSGSGTCQIEAGSTLTVYRVQS